MEIPYVEDELRVQRLHWMQTIAKDPSRHCLYIMVVFGDYRFEDALMAARKENAKQRPWRRQLHDDLTRLEKMTKQTGFTKR